jgi:hypothetical protein
VVGIRAAAVAVMAVLLALSSCSNDEKLIVGDSADAVGEVSDASVSDGVRFDDLIGSVWLIGEVSDGATINDELGRSLSFIGSNDEPAIFVGGPCGGGTLDVEQGESGIRIVSAKWDAGCTGSDLQTLFIPDRALEVAATDGTLLIRGNGLELTARHVQSTSIHSEAIPDAGPSTTAVQPSPTTLVVGPNVSPPRPSTPDPVAESATPTTAPLLSSTARAWNVQWVANSAFHGAVIEIGPVVSQGTDSGPGGTSDSPAWVESGSPMVFRSATVLESSSGGLSGEIILGDLDHAATEVPYAPYAEGDVMFLFISPQDGHTRPQIPIDDVFWVATDNDESKFDIVDDIATPRSDIVTALRKDDERLDPGLVTFSVADLLQVTNEAVGCVFIGAQNPFC